MKALMVLALVLVGGIARAGVCGIDDNVQSAQATLEKVQSEFDIGAAGTGDLSQAQINVAESKLCIDPLDAQATADLISATKTKLAYTKNAAAVGAASAFEVVLLENKIANLKANCDTLTKVFADREAVGDVSRADVETLKTACDSI